MPVVGKKSNRFEYRCDDGANALTAQEMFAMAVMSISRYEIDKYGKQEDIAFEKLSKIGENWIQETSSVNHSVFFLEGEKYINIDDRSYPTHAMSKGDEIWLLQEKYNGVVPKGYNKYNSADTSILDELVGKKPTDFTTIEVRPLNIVNFTSTEANKINNQIRVWTDYDAFAEEVLGIVGIIDGSGTAGSNKKTTTDGNTAGTIGGVSGEISGNLKKYITAEQAADAGLPVFEMTDMDSYKEAFTAQQITKEELRQIVIDKYIPLVGIYLYTGRYTAPKWECPDKFVKPEDFDKKTPEEQAALRSKWLNSECSNYYEKEPAKIIALKKALVEGSDPESGKDIEDIVGDLNNQLQPTLLSDEGEETLPPVEGEEGGETPPVESDPVEPDPKDVQIETLEKQVDALEKEVDTLQGNLADLQQMYDNVVINTDENTYIFKDTTTWTKYKLQEYGFLTESSTLVW